MDFFSIRRVPTHFGSSQFPALYDEGETHIATRIAEDDLCGGLRPTETEQAILNRLVREIHTRCPSVTLRQLTEALRFFCEIVMLFDRGHMAGPPLRYSWFHLSYNVWASVAFRAGMDLPGDTDPAKFRENILGVLEELGIVCTPEDLRGLLDRFKPKAEEGGQTFDLRQRIGLATGAIVQYVRYLHLAAIRHRACVKTRFVATRLFLVAADADARLAGKAQRYLASHGVSCSERPADAEAVLAILTEEAVESAAFWEALSAARNAGLRPVVLLDCPRTRLDRMQANVPSRYLSVFDWLIATTVVEYARGNRTGFVSILRGLEPAARWWWRDDAIQDVIAMDAFSVFESAEELRGDSGSTTRRYPDTLDSAGIAEGIALADMVQAERRDTAVPARTQKEYVDRIAALLDKRHRFPEGYYRLPWLVTAYHVRHRVNAIALGNGVALWDAGDVDQVAAALHGFGLHSKHGDIQAFLDALLALPWTAGLDRPEGRLERLRGFLAAVLSLGDSAFACNRKIRLKLPLHSSFVSYTSADAEFAKALVGNVEFKHNAEVWWDANSISIGQTLTQALTTGIEQSACFVLVASDAAARSRYVRLEAEKAADLRKPIIVVPPSDALGETWRASIDRWRADRLDVTVLAPGAPVDEVSASLVKALERSPQSTADWLAQEMARLP